MASNAGILLAQIATWNAQHPDARLDPNALLAVARQEGLGGGIGDGGHAFGAFQLNNSGGVATGLFPGETPQQENAWAWTPAGIQFALRHIASVAGGLTGRAAVTNIVSRFERPLNIPRETANALAALGLPAPAGGSLPSAAAAVTVQAAPVAKQPPGPSTAALQAILAASQAALSAPSPTITTGFSPLPIATQAAPPPLPALSFLSAPAQGPLAALAPPT